MAKSTGNILKIKDFKENVDGQVLKLALMSAHYKQPLDWNENLLEECKTTIDKWYEVYLQVKDKIVLDEDILSPLYDDLNTPGYIANLHQLYDKAKKRNENDKVLFVSACNFVGILNKTKEEWVEFKKKRSSINEGDILEMIALRNKAREDKNYKEADIIRNRLLDKGVLIEDKDGKTIWKFK
jgi:cysteinyl-tRNA synthetase